MTKPKKVVFITGCGEGIGLQLAAQLATNSLSADYIVVATALRLTKELEQLANNGVCQVKQMDVTNQSQCEEIVKNIIETNGRIDVLGISLIYCIKTFY